MHCLGERGLPFYCLKIGFLEFSEFLARYGIKMDPLVTERRQQSGKKFVLCMLGLLATLILGREQAALRSAYDEVPMMKRLPRRLI